MATDSKEAIAYLGLGSNLGDRVSQLRTALCRIDDHPLIRLDPARGVASLFETLPVGGPVGQPSYMNSAVRIHTSLTPHNLLDTLLGIEESLGRERRVRWGPRLIDLDLLLFGDVQCHDEVLTLPHPRLHQRLFVLEPLVEIAADVVHPSFHVRLAEFAHRCRANREAGSVRRMAGRDWHRIGPGSKPSKQRTARRSPVDHVEKQHGCLP